MKISDSIPKKSDAFLSGIDVFYSQFNDVSFFIEDEDQQNFYLTIFKKLFPNLKIIKVFPLNGKKNVYEKVKKNIGVKTKIFIVDKDFDDIIKIKKNYPNLFYLNHYSIENYLLQKEAFVNYIIEEKPKLKSAKVERAVNFESYKRLSLKLCKELTKIYILVQFYKLGVKNCKTPIDVFVSFNPGIRIKELEYNDYKSLVQNRLILKNSKYRLDSRLEHLRKIHNLSNEEIFRHIPGKYLVKIFKASIESKFALPNRNIESFNFRLAKLCTFDNLSYLKEEINDYLA